MQKTVPKNTKYSRNETIFKIAHLAKAIASSKSVIFGQKLKMQKNMRKTILQQHFSWSVQNTAKKNIKYSRNETILKMSHLAKAIAHAEAIAFAKLVTFRQKLKMQKNMRKTILQQHFSWSVQKTAPKNIKCSRNQIILKIGHLAKAIAHAYPIAFAEIVILGQKLKMQKT